MDSNVYSTSIFCQECIELSVDKAGFKCEQFNKRLRSVRECFVESPVKCKPCYEVAVINPNVD